MKLTCLKSLQPPYKQNSRALTLLNPEKILYLIILFYNTMVHFVLLNLNVWQVMITSSLTKVLKLFIQNKAFTHSQSFLIHRNVTHLLVPVISSYKSSNLWVRHTICKWTWQWNTAIYQTDKMSLSDAYIFSV